MTTNTSTGGQCSNSQNCPPYYYCDLNGECVYSHPSCDACGNYYCQYDSDCDQGQVCLNDQYCFDVMPPPPCSGGPDLSLQIPVPDGTGNGALSLAFMDADGDAARDLVVVRSTDATVIRTTGASIGLPLPPDVQLAGVVAGDFDGDGDDDLVLGDDQSSQLLLLLGDGSGGFTLSGGSNAATHDPVTGPP